MRFFIFLILAITISGCTSEGSSNQEINETITDKIITLENNSPFHLRRLLIYDKEGLLVTTNEIDLKAMQSISITLLAGEYTIEYNIFDVGRDFISKIIIPDNEIYTVKIDGSTVAVMVDNKVSYTLSSLVNKKFIYIDNEIYLAPKDITKETLHNIYTPPYRDNYINIGFESSVPDYYTALWQYAECTIATPEELLKITEKRGICYLINNIMLLDFTPIGDQWSPVIDVILIFNSFSIDAKLSQKSVSLYSGIFGYTVRSSFQNVRSNITADNLTCSSAKCVLGLIGAAYNTEVSGNSNITFSAKNIRGFENVGSIFGKSFSSKINNIGSKVEIYSETKYSKLGGLVGFSDNSIIVSSTVTSKGVGIVGQDSTEVGLAVGHGVNNTVITSSSFSGVAKSASITGGIAGHLQNSYISDSFVNAKLGGVTSKYAGGICGQCDNNTIVERTYFLGTTDGTYAGGLVGIASDSKFNNSFVVFDNNTNNKKYTAASIIGNNVFFTNIYAYSQILSIEMGVSIVTNLSTFKSKAFLNNLGFSDDVWNITGTKYPEHKDLERAK